MKYTFQQIQNIAGGQIEGQSSDIVLSKIFFDTRKIIIPKNGIFIAFVGKRDGHDFIDEAYKKGVRHFIVEQLPKTLKGATYLVTDSSLQLLQTLAKHHREQFDLPVIAITGSNGKTIVKEWLSTLFEPHINVLKSPMSYNSQIGVALSVLALHEQHEIAIFEVGIAQKGDMKALAEIVQCTFGIFTNIGDAHQSGFASLEEKIREKAKLFYKASNILYSSDYTKLDEILPQEYPEKKLIDFGKNGLYQTLVNVQNGVKTLDIIQDDTHYSNQLSFVEDFAAENLSHVIITALVLGLPYEDISKGIDRLHRSSIRIALKEGHNQNRIIDDSYSFDLISFESALSFLDKHGPNIDKVLIISDLPSFGDKNEAYKVLGELINEKDISAVYMVGKDAPLLSKMIKEGLEIKNFKNTDLLIEHLAVHPIWHAAILVKAGRTFQFERVVSFLSQKVHQTELEVNLTALQHNINVFAKGLKPQTKILAVIKANAYGTGSFALASFLENAGIDYLAVAYIDEGITLREKGINLPILVLNPEMSYFDKLAAYHLEPEIYSFHQLEQLISYQKHGQKIGVHIKLDTGMNRLGFKENELEKLMALLKNHKIHVVSIISHLAAADEPSKDSWTQKQLHRFEKMTKKMIQHLGYNPIRHILNTSGTIRFPEHQYDMIRIGKGMYGIDTTNLFSDQLEKVHQLFARVSQIKSVSAGETIGYGCHTVVDENKEIAIVGIGYADGLIRNLGNGNISFKINEHMAKTIGNICMDMFMLDITGLDNINIGDRVEIFGNQLDIFDLSKAAGTIPLEILSRLSNRIQKIYIED